MFGSPYQLRYDICAFVVFLVIILIFFRKKDIFRNQNKLFIGLAALEMLSVVGDFFASVMTANQDIFPRPLGSFFHIMYLFCHLAISGCFTGYIIFVCGAEHKLKKVQYGIVFFPYFAVSLMILTNPIHSRIFYYNEQGLYTRGPWMIAMYVAAVYYMVLSIMFLCRYHSSLKDDKLKSLIAFIAASIAATFFQMIFRYILIELFTQSIAGLWILFAIENDEDIINPVTKVYNRRAFVDAVSSPVTSMTEFKIVLIKLTNLNYYTNLVGYSFMQRITRDIAQHLSKSAGFANVFDLENGSFAVTIYKNAKALDSDESVEDRICSLFMENWIFEDAELDFNTQLCIINLPRDLCSIEELMTIADVTNVKTGNKVTIVQNDILQQVKRQADVENAIVDAVHNKTFEVYFQPIWDAKANKIHSAEALVRLNDRELGMISPEEFIPLAEKNGTIKDIGEFVFEETCRFYKESNLKELGIDFIEVNMSTAQLVNKDLAEKLNLIMKKYGLDSRTINLEITESSAINTPEAFQKTIKELHGLDFNFSLDDYGTGYSNLSYICNMDFAIIKIDKSVLWEAEKNETAHIILQNTVHMIKEMNVRIVVEGVETQSQKDLVLSLGCDYIQGYIFCKPVPEAQFIRYVDEFNKMD